MFFARLSRGVARAIRSLFVQTNATLFFVFCFQNCGNRDRHSRRARSGRRFARSTNFHRAGLLRVFTRFVCSGDVYKLAIASTVGFQFVKQRPAICQLMNYGLLENEFCKFLN